MQTIAPSRFLKAVLAADALVSGAVGLLQLAITGPLASLLHLPAPVLLESGVFLLAYAAGLLFLASRAKLPAWPILIVIGGNVLWAAGCAFLGMHPQVQATGLGMLFLGVQIASVLLFAALQAEGLRRSAPLRGAGIA